MLHGKGSEEFWTVPVAWVSPGCGVPTLGTGAVAAPAAAALAVKANVPSIGWESELTTRHTTVYFPAGAPSRSFCEATLSTISTLPSAQSVPEASVTLTSEPSPSGVL